MNEAQKFKRKVIKIVEIDGSNFKIRKLNPADSDLMHIDLPPTKYKENEDGQFELDDKGEKIPLPIDRKILQDAGRKEMRIILTRAVMSPKIVEKEFGQEEEDEIPLELVDADTAIKLSNEITNFSYGVHEDEGAEVGLKSFPEKTDREDVDDNSDKLKDTPIIAGGELRSKIGATSEDKA